MDDPASLPIYVTILIVLILLSAFFSATETAFSSLNKARLKTQLEENNKKVSLAYKLAENYDKVLFTILVGNNIVNIASATISTFVFAILINNPSLSATVSTIVMTAIVLIFGEITPKSVAKEMPEKFASAVSYPLQFFVIILYPLTFIFGCWKVLLSKVFKLDNKDKITEEELLTYVEEANEDGTLDNNETELISSAIEFADAEVGEILVPRVNIVGIDVNMDMEEIKNLFLENGFSRMPVYQKSIDKIIGMIHEKDFYRAYSKGEQDINGIITSMAIATEHMKLKTLLASMQKQKVHMAVVVDEYGGTLGIVTLEDILEEIVGEIWDEHDEIVEYFSRIDDNNYIVDGNAELSDFFELFSIQEDVDEFDSNTVSGWVIEKCGDLPKLNYTFDYERLTITILKRNQRKILQIKVEINERETAEE